MCKREIFLRVDLLIDVFAYSLLHPRTLNVGQRICLTQERVAWLEVLEWYDEEIISPKYVIPELLENKLQEIVQKIEKTDWVKPKYEPLF